MTTPSDNWTFTLNKVLDDARLGEPLFWLKETMKAAGYVVTKSGDNATYDPSGDCITSAGTAAGGMTRLRAWFVVRRPDGVEFCFQQTSITMGDTGGTVAGQRVMRSQSAGFVGGSPNANTVPTASDETLVLGGGTPASPTNGPTFSKTPTGHVVHVGVSKNAPFDWYVFTHSSTQVTAAMVWLTAANTSPSDAASKEFLVEGRRYDSPYALTDTSAWPGLQSTFQVFESTFGSILSAMSNINNSSTTDDTEFPMLWAKAGNLKGNSPTMRWHFPRRSQPVYTCDVGGDPRIVAANVSLPWPSMDDVPAIGTRPAIGGLTARLVSTGASTPDTTPPVITNVTPAPGSALSAYDAVGFDVTDESGLRLVMVTIRHAGLTEVCHDGSQFIPPYEWSTRTDIANGYHYEIVRNDGWKAGPTMAVYPIDVNGNMP